MMIMLKSYQETSLNIAKYRPISLSTRVDQDLVTRTIPLFLIGTLLNFLMTFY